MIQAKFAERRVQFEEIFWRIVNAEREIIEGPLLQAAAPLDPTFSSGSLDQDPTHRLSGGGEEVPSIVPVSKLLAIDKSDVGFMHQGCSLQCLTGSLSSHRLRRQFPQLVVDEWQELVGGQTVLLDGRQSLGHITHTSSNRANHCVPCAEDLALGNHTKKADVAGYPEVFDHVGLLANGLPYGRS